MHLSEGQKRADVRTAQKVCSSRTRQQRKKIMSDLVVTFPSPHGQVISNQDLLQPCKTKFNRKSAPRQDFVEKNFYLAQKIQEDPASFYNSLTDGAKRLFDYFIAVSFRCRHLYFTQAHIAQKINLSVRQVQRLLDELIELGVIIKRYRHMTSCEYRFNTFFQIPSIRGIIRNISKGAKFVSLALLLPFQRVEANELVPNQNSECRTRTLKVSYINRVTLQYYIKGSKRSPRLDSDSEFFESSMINFSKQLIQQKPFGAEIDRLGLILSLSDAGKVEFTRYPEEAVTHVMNMFLLLRKTVDNPIAWAHSVCIKYCNDNSKKIDWAYPHQLARTLGLELHAPKIQSVYDMPKEDQGKILEKSRKVASRIKMDPKMAQQSSEYNKKLFNIKNKDESIVSSSPMPTLRAQSSKIEQQGMHSHPPSEPEPARIKEPTEKIIERLTKEESNDHFFKMFRDMIVKGMTSKA